MTSSYAAVKEKKKKIWDSSQISSALSISRATFNQLNVSPLGFLPNSIRRPVVSTIVRVCVCVLIAVNCIKSFKRQNIYIYIHIFPSTPPSGIHWAGIIHSQQSPGWECVLQSLFPFIVEVATCLRGTQQCCIGLLTQVKDSLINPMTPLYL